MRPEMRGTCNLIGLSLIPQLRDFNLSTHKINNFYGNNPIERICIGHDYIFTFIRHTFITINKRTNI